MTKTKKNIKVRDLKPSKDAKGGGAHVLGDKTSGAHLLGDKTSGQHTLGNKTNTTHTLDHHHGKGGN